GRAERLFAVKQYVPARAAFDSLKPRATDGDRRLIQLRLAECDYLQKRTKLAKDALAGMIDEGSRRGEALYYYAVASRDLGDETITYFEHASADFPRSDYRPSWLYWAGRAHDELKERIAAEQRYNLVATDYLNSYYGRLAVNRLGHAPISQAIAVADTVSGSD